MFRCDLCHATDASRCYPTRPAYDPWWVCAECAEFIDNADPAGLLIRALLVGGEGARAAQDIRRTHESFWYTIDLRQAVKA